MLEYIQDYKWWYRVFDCCLEVIQRAWKSKLLLTDEHVEKSINSGMFLEKGKCCRSFQQSLRNLQYLSVGYDWFSTFWYYVPAIMLRLMHK